MRFKKYAVIICVMLALGSVMGQNMKSLEFMVGSLNPENLKSGMIWDFKYGIAVDEAVDISLGIAYFRKTYKEETTVADSVNSTEDYTTKQQTLEYNSNLFPITANATIHTPISPQFGVYFGAGLSWQILISKENNFEENIDETRNYNGFGWVARVGAEWQLGTRSSLIGELYYNNCKVKGNKEIKTGLPTWDEVDVTGLGFKVGLRVELY